LGIPSSRAGIRLSYVAMIPIVALTIWGYVDICNRGRIAAGNIDVHRSDFTVFTEAGAAFFDGRDPYQVTNPRGWFYLYPPLFALAVSPLACLDSQSQVVAWYVASAVLGFGCYFESRRLWRLVATSRSAQGTDSPDRFKSSFGIGACALLAVSLPALDCLQRGQLGILLVYLLLLGLRLTLSSRFWAGWWLGGVVLACPVVFKLTPALPVALLVLHEWTATLAPQRSSTSRDRATALTLGIACGAFLFVLALPAACVGWGKNLHYLETWVQRVASNPAVGEQAKFHIDSISNQSLGNAAHRLAATVRGPVRDPSGGKYWLAVDTAIAQQRQNDQFTGRVVQISRAVIVALLLAVVVRVSLTSDKLAKAAAFGLAMLATLLVSPLAWGHYYVLVLPAVLFAPLWLKECGHPAVSRILATGLPALIWMHYVLMPWTGPIGLLGLGTTLWFLVACAFSLVARAPSRGETPASLLDLRADSGHDVRFLGYRPRFGAGVAGGLASANRPGPAVPDLNDHALGGPRR
jgi:hypothetical protein